MRKLWRRSILAAAVCLAVLSYAILLTACSSSEPMPETPDMDFLIEFFTVNKDGRMDAYLEALSRGEDPQDALDVYYASLAPYVEESVLAEMQEANYLYLFDKACTDYADRWEWKRVSSMPRTREGEVLHAKYQIDLQHSGFGLGHKVSVIGYYDMDEDRKILSFTLDTETLPQ